MGALLFLLAFKWGDPFDHAEHAAKARQKIDCRTCHKMDGRFRMTFPGKRNGHEPCASCHKKDWFPGHVCATCHPGGNLKQVRDLQSPSAFHVSFQHAGHVRAVSATPAGARCGGCHPKQDPSGERAASTANSHEGCGTCHSGGGLAAKLDMNQCGACHQTGVQAAQLTSTAHMPSIYRVSSAFSNKEVRDTEFHAGHYKRTKSKSVDAPCTKCHIGLDQANVAPRRPSMQACEQCHNARVSFDARGTQCPRCHVKREGT
jgi:hypothetical protein